MTCKEASEAPLGIKHLFTCTVCARKSLDHEMFPFQKGSSGTTSSYHICQGQSEDFISKNGNRRSLSILLLYPKLVVNELLLQILLHVQ